VRLIKGKNIMRKNIDPGNPGPFFVIDLIVFAILTLVVLSILSLVLGSAFPTIPTGPTGRVIKLSAETGDLNYRYFMTLETDRETQTYPTAINVWQGLELGRCYHFYPPDARGWITGGSVTYGPGCN
jgi:hypothetical protein